jgi:hypothetical protein
MQSAEQYKRLETESQRKVMKYMKAEIPSSVAILNKYITSGIYFLEHCWLVLWIRQGSGRFYIFIKHYCIWGNCNCNALISRNGRIVLYKEVMKEKIWECLEDICSNSREEKSWSWRNQKD